MSHLLMFCQHFFSKKKLVQDARFGLDKDEQTTFIDSQGKLNPKAVKWSEVGLA